MTKVFGNLRLVGDHLDASTAVALGPHASFPRHGVRVVGEEEPGNGLALRTASSRSSKDVGREKYRIGAKMHEYELSFITGEHETPTGARIRRTDAHPCTFLAFSTSSTNPGVDNAVPGSASSIIP